MPRPRSRRNRRCTEREWPAMAAIITCNESGRAIRFTCARDGGRAALCRSVVDERGWRRADVAGAPRLGPIPAGAGGQPVILRGVNRSGTEYACIQGLGIFDGPSDEASVRAIAAWHVNFVRVLLNEDCWLGINGVKPRVRRPELPPGDRQVRQAAAPPRHLCGDLADLGSAGTRSARPHQPRAPDEDHSPAMWASMAATFKNDPDVLLAPWGEPVVSARCLLRGGLLPAAHGPTTRHYRTAGMQQAVNVMRRRIPRADRIPGVNYANDMRSGSPTSRATRCTSSSPRRTSTARTPAVQRRASTRPWRRWPARCR